MIALAQNGTPVTSWPVSRYVAEVYCAERLNLSPRTVENIELACRQLDEWKKSPFLLSDFSRQTVIDWMRWLAEGRKVAPATVNGRRASIMAVWNDAAFRGLAAQTPRPDDRRARIPKYTEPERIPVTWSLAELDCLFAACDRTQGEWDSVPQRRLWTLALLICWDTGCRLREMLLARMEHLDAERKTLYIPAENRKGRRRDRLYLLHDQTIAAFRATLPSSRERIFPYPYCLRTLQKQFTEIILAAGLPADCKRKFHCIRRTAESYAAREKGNQWAADAVGHNLSVAMKSYISPVVAPGPSLVNALPRPQITHRSNHADQAVVLVHSHRSQAARAVRSNRAAQDYSLKMTESCGPDGLANFGELFVRLYSAARSLDVPSLPDVPAPAWWRTLLIVARTTVLPRRSLFDLRMDHIDWKGQRIMLPEGKTVDLKPLAIEHLQGIRSERDLVFPWPFGVRAFQYWFHRLQQQAGIPKKDQFGLRELRSRKANRPMKPSRGPTKVPAAAIAGCCVDQPDQEEVYQVTEQVLVAHHGRLPK